MRAITAIVIYLDQLKSICKSAHVWPSGLSAPLKYNILLCIHIFLQCTFFRLHGRTNADDFVDAEVDDDDDNTNRFRVVYMHLLPTLIKFYNAMSNFPTPCGDIRHPNYFSPLKRCSTGDNTERCVLV